LLAHENLAAEFKRRNYPEVAIANPRREFSADHAPGPAKIIGSCRFIERNDLDLRALLLALNHAIGTIPRLTYPPQETSLDALELSWFRNDWTVPGLHEREC
jgi:hypothetical protein